MFCAKCGNQLNDGDNFCDVCGDRIDAASGASAQGSAAPRQSNNGTATTIGTVNIGSVSAETPMLPLAIFVGVLIVVISAIATMKHALIINAILTAVIAVSALWVYLDATTHSIGKIAKEHGGRGLLNLSAAGWGWCTLLLWIVGLPSYILKRNALIEKAREYPVSVANRTASAITLAVVGAFEVVVVVALYFAGTVPSCDSKDVVGLADRIVKEGPMSLLLGDNFRGVSMPAEQSYDAARERRVCRAMITVASQEVPVSYTVEWHDKSKGLIWVQFLSE
jgi:hypothetical protein